MHRETLESLQTQGLLTEEQFEKLEAIRSRKIFSVFYELRTLLYLGVMLFTTGIGLLIYLNIGQLGHILAVCAIGALCVASLVYCFIKGKPFSVHKVEAPNPYFDYVLLLGALLLAGFLGYLEFLFEVLQQFPRLAALVTAFVYMTLAYRFDHLGVLSLGITALASFFGLTITFPDFDSLGNLYNIGIAFSVGLAIVALGLEMKGIKKHFAFTYLNFGLLIFFICAFAGMFEYGNPMWVYLLLTYAGLAASFYLARKFQSFLFFLYGVVAAYSCTTGFLIESTSWEVFWLYYFLFSCGGFIWFIIKFKNYFKQS